MIIFTKFHEDWTKIVDSLLMANFWTCLLFTQNLISKIQIFWFFLAFLGCFFWRAFYLTIMLDLKLRKKEVFVNIFKLLRTLGLQRHILAHENRGFYMKFFSYCKISVCNTTLSFTQWGKSDRNESQFFLSADEL